MEKFAVDLDKVLDDFEYNEEQAVRHSQYIKEDLPAKKYQRPPFQRINLEDADFSPSKQTSSPLIPYVSSHSELVTSIKSSISKENVSDYDQINSNDNLDVVANNTSVVEDIISIPDLLGNDVPSDETAASLKLPDLTEIGSDVVVECDLTSCDLISGNIEVEPAHIKGNDETASEMESTNFNSVIFSHDSAEVIVDDSAESSDVSPDSCETEETNVISQLITVDSNEEKDDSLETPSSEIIQTVPVATVEEIKESENDNSSNEQLVDCIVEQETSIEETAETVIKYETDECIADDELDRCLQELEEEEEDAIVSIETDNPVTLESEEKPPRPSYLGLTNFEIPEAGSAGNTPIVREVRLPNEDHDNEINERDEATSAEKTPSDDVEDVPPDSPLVDDSLSSPAESPTSCQLSVEERRLGKICPFWVPDADALTCMQCSLKFTVIKRRHHCRACGRVLCSKCCAMRASLEYLGNQEHRVCENCFRTLAKVMMYEAESDSEAETSPRKRPNPNNPMEYCSTVPPALQASPSGSQPPPSVLVPVLKREGSSRGKETPKKVMFSDGIRPGGDLTSLDQPPPPRVQRIQHGSKRVGTPPGAVLPAPIRMLPAIDRSSQSFILDMKIPPLCTIADGQTLYHEPMDDNKLLERLRDPEQPPLRFAVNRHLTITLKIVKLDCCMGQSCWVFSTRGMATVGQDEILMLLQLTGDDDEQIPVEIFQQFHSIYQAADKGIGEITVDMDFIGERC